MQELGETQKLPVTEAKEFKRSLGGRAPASEQKVMAKKRP
jgi:hypothetical protein